MAVRCDAVHLLRTDTAQALSPLGRTPLLDEYLTDSPAASLRMVGAGQVAYIPFDLFAYHYRVGYTTLRRFINHVVRAFGIRFPLQVSAPSGVDVVLRQRETEHLIHLINRLSGVGNTPNNGGIDEIPVLGPVEVHWQCEQAPHAVTCEPGAQVIKWSFDDGTLRIVLDRLHIHTILRIETAATGEADHG